MSNQNKLSPHLYSVKAESAVIGGLLLDNSLFDQVIRKINSADFHFGIHQVLFKGITDLIEAGKPSQTAWAMMIEENSAGRLIHWNIPPFTLSR